MKINSTASDGSLRAGDWLTQARGALVARRGLLLGDREDLPDGQEASIEVQVLLAHVLQRPKSWLLAHPETRLTVEQLARLTGLMDQLAEGVPLPYLTGVQAFYGLDFEVSPAVLIPRPETELLVEQAILWLQKHPGRLRAAEVGVGSGCISISVAKSNPWLKLLAVDRSRPALEIASRNARRHGVTEQISFSQGDLLSAAAGPFDLVCANLPYIPAQALTGLAVTQHEPRLALDGGKDGLRLIAALIQDSPRWLAPGGLMLLEIQYDQGTRISEMIQKVLPGAAVRILLDLAGLPRLVLIENS